MSSVVHLLYADDLQVYTQTIIDELNEGIRRLSIIGRAVSVWATNNVLSLNVNKTKAIIVPSVDTVTNLVMDSKLTWKAQVEAVNRRVNRALYGLIRFRSCTTEMLRVARTSKEAAKVKKFVRDSAFSRDWVAIAILQIAPK